MRATKRNGAQKWRALFPLMGGPQTTKTIDNNNNSDSDRNNNNDDNNNDTLLLLKMPGSNRKFQSTPD